MSAEPNKDVLDQTQVTGKQRFNGGIFQLQAFGDAGVNQKTDQKVERSLPNLVKLNKNEQKLDDERYKLLLALHAIEHEDINQKSRGWWAAAAASVPAFAYGVFKKNPVVAATSACVNLTSLFAGVYLREQFLESNRNRYNHVKFVADDTFFYAIKFNQHFEERDWETSREILRNVPVITSQDAKRFAYSEQKRNGLYYISDEQATYMVK